jgi:hypothetical protein
MQGGRAPGPSDPALPRGQNNGCKHSFDVAYWPVSTVRRAASIRPVLEAKRTLRGDRQSVEIDPKLSWAAQ